MPSTGSKFSKAFKKCLVAPKDYLIYTADFNALEDRIIANLSKDKNKCAVFTDKIDGHCLNSYFYFRDEVEKELPRLNNEDEYTYIRRYHQEVENGNKVLKKIRQKGKNITFALAYGAYPPKLIKYLKCDIKEAERIFNNYHDNLYCDISKYRNKVLDIANKDKEIHFGLGCYIKTDNPEAEIRSVFNGTSQFWSILSLLSINKLHKLIDENNYQNDIKVINTIYDSIYLIVKKDPIIIKWLNDNLINLMTKDFIENQIVHNEACGEIGYNWYDLKPINNNASIEEINNVINEL